MDATLIFIRQYYLFFLILVFSLNRRLCGVYTPLRKENLNFRFGLNEKEGAESTKFLRRFRLNFFPFSAGAVEFVKIQWTGGIGECQREDLSVAPVKMIRAQDAR